MPAKGKQLKTLELGTNVFGNDFTYLGNNPTGGVANDTMAFWRDKGSGYAYFNATNQVNDQKGQYGFLINIVNEGNEIHQEWYDQSASTPHFSRKANSSTTAMPNWNQIGGGSGDVSGVKGNKETTYRTGDVNLTPANIGAVNLAGDTMTGNLFLKHESVDTKLANNGSTSTQTRTVAFGRDKNNLNYSWIDAYARADGSISSILFTRNYNTAGTAVSTANISLTVNKNGTSAATCNADVPSATDQSTKIATTQFVWNAIKNSHNQPRADASANGNIASGTSVVDLNKGMYTAAQTGLFIGWMRVTFGANASGARYAQAGKYNSGGTFQNGVGGIRTAPPSSGTWVANIPLTVQMTQGEKLGVRGFQNSGASLTWDAYLYGKIFIT